MSIGNNMISRRKEIASMWVIILCFPVLANETVSGDIETGSVNHRPLVQIFLEPVQGKIKGPDLHKDYGSSGFTIGGISSAFGLPAALAGVGIDSALGYVNSQGTDGVQPARADEARLFFDYYHAVKNGIQNLDENAHWELSHIDESKHTGKKTSTAGQIFLDSDIEHVVFIESTYFFSPGLDQVRLIVDIDVLSRPKDVSTQHDIIKRTELTYERTYEYLSQSRGILLRPFHDGEKEALIESIESEFDRKVDRYPNNRAVYKKDRDRALKALKKRDVILPAMALSEGWPGRTFPIALQLATDGIMQMMQDDLIDVHGSKAKKVEYVSFGGLDRKGKSKRFKAYVVGQQGSNTIYRDKRDNMYSVPDGGGS